MYNWFLEVGEREIERGSEEREVCVEALSGKCERIAINPTRIV